MHIAPYKGGCPRGLDGPGTDSTTEQRPDMTDPAAAHAWQPVDRAERIAALDVLRGVALLGVLLVNLLSDFRIPLSEHILTFHPGRANRVVDVLVASLLEFKAFALFSLSFGAGVAVLAKRASSRGVDVPRFLARRFLVLLALGL